MASGARAGRRKGLRHMASVTLQGVTKRFGEVVAVNNLNIEVQDQEFLVLVGPVRLWEIDNVAAHRRARGVE